MMLKICDNGIGIPEIKQKYLFTSTEIESTPGTENEKGTGLGLKLCYELVKINQWQYYQLKARKVKEPAS